MSQSKATRPEPTRADRLAAYFRRQERKGRGQSINGVLYFDLTETDRRAFPELADYFGIAVEELSSGNLQHWLFRTESAFDDEVLAALSSAGMTGNSGLNVQ